MKSYQYDKHKFYIWLCVHGETVFYSKTHFDDELLHNFLLQLSNFYKRDFLCHRNQKNQEGIILSVIVHGTNI